MITSNYEKLWNDPAIAGRIEEGIEKNRKSSATIRVQDAAGNPLSGADITITQLDSSYLFGANIFMLTCYDSDELNERYAQAFVGLFNAATVPFYWRDLEPEPGALRFAPNSRRIRRRPPPDAVVEFCRRHNLNMNGHVLVWDFIKWSMPDWYPDDTGQGKALLEKRIREIAERYGNVIPRWDVLNESLCSPERVANKQSRAMPEDYELLSFQLADKYFPASAHLMINEVTSVFRDWADRYVDQIRGLIARGARINGVGMQFHAFSNDENLKIMRGEIHTPAQLLSALDKVGELHLPIHVSEITLTALADDRAGREAQAKVARNFYRLWFSHPATHAITWWNLPDGGAAPGEDKVASGLIDAELRPKYGYEVLHDLIQREWRTNLNTRTDDHGAVNFRGFHGRYRATVGSTQVEFSLVPGSDSQIFINLAQEK